MQNEWLTSGPKTVDHQWRKNIENWNIEKNPKEHKTQRIDGGRKQNSQFCYLSVKYDFYKVNLFI